MAERIELNFEGDSGDARLATDAIERALKDLEKTVTRLIAEMRKTMLPKREVAETVAGYKAIEHAAHQAGEEASKTNRKLTEAAIGSWAYQRMLSNQGFRPVGPVGSFDTDPGVPGVYGSRTFPFTTGAAAYMGARRGGGGGGRPPDWRDLSFFDELFRGIAPGGTRARTGALSLGATLLGAGIGAAGPAVLGGAAGLTASLGPLAAIITTLTSAFSGLGDALGGDREAFEALDAQSQEFVLHLRGFIPVFEDIQASVRGGLFPGVQEALDTALNVRTMGVVKEGLTGIAEALGQAAIEWGNWIGSEQFAQRTESILGSTANLTGIWSDTALALADSLLILTDAAQPMLTWMSEGLRDGAEWIDMWLQQADATGELAQMLEGTKDEIRLVLEFLEKLVVVLWDLAAVLKPLGEELLVTLIGMFEDLSEWLERNRKEIGEELVGAFEGLKNTIETLWPILLQLLEWVWDFIEAFGGLETAMYVILSGAALNAFLKLVPAIQGAVTALIAGEVAIAPWLALATALGLIAGYGISKLLEGEGPSDKQTSPGWTMAPRNRTFEAGDETIPANTEVSVYYKDGAWYAAWIVKVPMGRGGRGFRKVEHVEEITLEQAAAITGQTKKALTGFASSIERGTPGYPTGKAAGERAKQLAQVLGYVEEYGVGSGITYTFGGISPETGFDCSGFLAAAYASAGVQIPHNAAQQFRDPNAIRVARNQIQPGDGLYFDNGQGGEQPGHCGIAVSSGPNAVFIEYYSAGKPAKQNTINAKGGYMGARRWIAVESGVAAGIQANVGGGGAGGGGGTSRGEPPPFEGTAASDLLPSAMRGQLERDDISIPAQINVRKRAIAYLRAQMPKLDPAQKAAATKLINDYTNEIDKLVVRGFQNAISSADITPGAQDDIATRRKAIRFLTKYLPDIEDPNFRRIVKDYIQQWQNEVESLLKDADIGNQGRISLAIRVDKALRAFAALPPDVKESLRNEIDSIQDMWADALADGVITKAEQQKILKAISDFFRRDIPRAMKTHREALAREFESAAKDLARSFFEAFDEETRKWKSPTELLIEKMNKERTEADLQRAVDDARKALDEAMRPKPSDDLSMVQEITARYKLARQVEVAQLGVMGADTGLSSLMDDFLRELEGAMSAAAETVDQEAVKDAQRQLEEALYDQRMYYLELQAEAERKAYETQREELRKHLELMTETWITALSAMIQAGRIGVQEAMSLFILAMAGLVSLKDGQVVPTTPASSGSPMEPGQAPATTTSGQSIPMGFRRAMAQGGIIEKPVFLMGEAGAELISPLPVNWRTMQAQALYGAAGIGGDGTGAAPVYVQISSDDELLGELLSRAIDVRVSRNTSIISEKIGRLADRRSREGRH